MQQHEPRRFERYYHMFAEGELVELATEATHELGLVVGRAEGGEGSRAGVEIVQQGWERSNYYVELQRWSR